MNFEDFEKALNMLQQSGGGMIHHQAIGGGTETYQVEEWEDIEQMGYDPQATTISALRWGGLSEEQIQEIMCAS